MACSRGVLALEQGFPTKPAREMPVVVLALSSTPVAVVLEDGAPDAYSSGGQASERMRP